MKNFLILCTLYLVTCFSSFAFIDPKIGGTITVKDNKLVTDEKTLLVVVAIDPKTNQIVAKMKMNHPKFPQAFVVTPKHLISQSLILDHSVLINAFLFLGSNESEKPILKGNGNKKMPVEVGNKNLLIELEKN